mmetsp:Transcript_20636/g.38823  ORF Transcript_20636/g.38823 Transcript_20636/m.38823 type:complete len:95 (+) Transcript_20636:30-314(+)
MYNVIIGVINAVNNTHEHACAIDRENTTNGNRTAPAARLHRPQQAPPNQMLAAREREASAIGYRRLAELVRCWRRRRKKRHPSRNTRRSPPCQS